MPEDRKARILEARLPSETAEDRHRRVVAWFDKHAADPIAQGATFDDAEYWSRSRVSAMTVPTSFGEIRIGGAGARK